MIDIPKHMRGRPTYGGYIVPYFVSWFLDNHQVNERTPGAKPDFKVIDIRRLNICRQRSMCWICGKQLGSFKWFAFGPSSALSRQSVEPPSHSACAHYAVQTCPYMLNPGSEHKPVTKLRPFEYVYENVDTNHPEVCVLWATKGWDPIPIDPTRGIFYFLPHEPDVVEFWREGRKATRAEIVASIDKALETNKVSRNDRDVAWRIQHLMRFVPSEEQAA